MSTVLDPARLIGAGTQFPSERYNHMNDLPVSRLIMRKILFIGLLAASTALPAQSPVATWTAQHQRAIVDEFISLLSIPNVARN
ncbi:MAG TPA: hypothetical protein VIK50_15320, partial [Gemmatimonadaceae bacterium]